MIRRNTVAMLALAVPLSGCVLAIGNSPDEEGATGKRLKAIETRLDALEKRSNGTMPGMISFDGNGKAMPVGNATIVLSGSDGKPILMRAGENEIRFEIKEDGEGD